METMQIYSIETQHPDKAAPGQFVFENDESNVLIGFLLEVDGTSVTIVLFDPVPAIPEASIIHSGPLPDEDLQVLLAALFIKYPEAKQYWDEALNGSIQQ